MSSDDIALFNTVNNKLLNPPGASIRHIPIKIYLPTSPAPVTNDDSASELPQAGSIRVIQTLVPPLSPSRAYSQIPYPHLEPLANKTDLINRPINHSWYSTQRSSSIHLSQPSESSPRIASTARRHCAHGCHDGGSRPSGCVHRWVLARRSRHARVEYSSTEANAIA